MESRPDLLDPRQVKSGATQDGFTQVKNRKRSRAPGQSNSKKDTPSMELRSRNALETLGGLEEDETLKEK